MHVHIYTRVDTSAHSHKKQWKLCIYGGNFSFSLQVNQEQSYIFAFCLFEGGLNEMQHHLHLVISINLLSCGFQWRIY